MIVYLDIANDNTFAELSIFYFPYNVQIFPYLSLYILKIWIYWENRNLLHIALPSFHLNPFPSFWNAENCLKTNSDSLLKEVLNIWINTVR